MSKAISEEAIAEYGWSNFHCYACGEAFEVPCHLVAEDEESAPAGHEDCFN